MEGRLLEWEYAQTTCMGGVYLTENMLKQHTWGALVWVRIYQTRRRGVYLTENMLKQHAGGAFIWLRICSNNMQEGVYLTENMLKQHAGGAFVWVRIYQTRTRGIYLSYVIKRYEGAFIWVILYSKYMQTGRLIELEYDQTLWRGVYLSDTILKIHANGALNWVRIWSNVMKGRLFEWYYTQNTCKRGA